MKRWGDKPYHSMDFDLKEKYKEKVYKITLDGGMTCPNRDGKVGTRGCIFCSVKGSGDFAGSRKDSIPLQLEKGKKDISSKMSKSPCLGNNGLLKRLTPLRTGAPPPNAVPQA